MPTPQHHIIKETSDSLSRLFQEEFKRNGYKRVHMLDQAPKPDVVEGKMPAVCVYLYQISLDAEGLSGNATHEMVEVAQDDGSTKEFARLRRLWLRLDYLMSAWAQTPEDEQLLLGLVVRTLCDNRSLTPEKGLRGDSFGAGFKLYPIIGTRLDEGTLARFWGSLQQPIRPAVSCWCHVPIIPETMDPIVRVTQRELRYRNTLEPDTIETGPSSDPFTRRDLNLGGGES